MKKRSKFSRFFGGIFLGIFIFVVFLGGIYVGRIGGEKLLNLLDFKNKREKVDYTFLKWNFKIGFEKNKELEVFQPHQAAMRQSTQYATQGQHSLWVEFPAGRSYPGIATEVYGKDCFDWSDMEEFSFDVYNEVEIPTHFTIKIKSGRDDPKKEFKTSLTLPAQETGRIKIARRELEYVLDLECISALNFFIEDPRTTFYLYFDNFKVTARSRRVRPAEEVKEIKID